MCGIVAISTSNNDMYTLDDCLRTISHRGPDDSGSYISKDRDCYLGHVRLTILDLSFAGHQPMPDVSGRFLISYNGEIYNYRELKHKLEEKYKDIIWKSTTDTELIVEGFSREGVSFLEELNGIFALAIYDSNEHILHVIRDPLGVKPLFVTRYQNNTFFCSEIKGLLTFCDTQFTIRKKSMLEQLVLMYIPEPYTIYENIFKLKPGILFSYKNGKLISEKKLFSHLENPIFFNSEKDVIDMMDEAFSQAVKRQIISDVPISLFLSGGLDSSAVAWHAVNSGAQIKDAYTIRYSKKDSNIDEQSDDFTYAQIMAKNLGLELKVVDCNSNYLSLLPEIIEFMEDGFSDPAAINTYVICNAARQNGVKVMLSGQGADEYLGGYRKYLAGKLLGYFPHFMRYPFALMEKTLPVNLPGKMNALNRRAKKFFGLAATPYPQNIINLYTWGNWRNIRNLFKEEMTLDFDEEVKNYFFQDKENIPERMMNLDHHYDLLSLNLCYTDRMSMAVGVEIRVPFLDFQMVHVMNSIPINLKIKGMCKKYILKKTMEPYLPTEVIYREKAGFGLPIRSWMNADSKLIKHYLNPKRIEQQGIFSASAIEQLLAEQYMNRADHSYIIMSLLVQQIWLDSQKNKTVGIGI